MTSISPWVVTLDALKPFAVPSIPRNVPEANYLKDSNAKGTYDVELHVDMYSTGPPTRTCTVKLESMYWSFRHIFAHQTIVGSGLESGDILATGTASGMTPDSLGCLLETTMGGKNDLELLEGSKRTYLEDGDTVILSGFAGSEEDGVGFGQCVGKVVAATILRESGSY